MGKLLFIVGLVLVVVGAVIGKTGGLGPFGRLPGDLTIQTASPTISLPLVPGKKEGGLLRFAIVTCLLPMPR